MNLRAGCALEKAEAGGEGRAALSMEAVPVRRMPQA
jgi:hypothetical protein